MNKIRVQQLKNFNQEVLDVIAAGGISIDDLDDVTLGSPGPSDGDVLIWGGSPGAFTPQRTKISWQWNGARNNNNVTNSYLTGIDGSLLNLSAYIAPTDCKLKMISASTDGNETWTAQVRVNGTSVATLSITANDFGTDDTLNVSISAGDEVTFYCSGTNINKPKIMGFFLEI